MVDFDLRQLEIFKKVVELGSFSKAADAVFLAQASVSERIATLESQVGIKLLDRLGRQIVPTKAGELLYKHAVLLLEMKATAALEMQAFLGLKKGEIHIGGSTIPGEYILPKILGRFREKYPLVSVRVSISDTQNIEKKILEGQFELGIIGSKSAQKNIVQHELWEDELVLGISSKHPWAGRQTITLDELAGEPFIARQAGSGTLKTMEGCLRNAGVLDADSFNIVARLGSSTAVKEAIKAGLGVSLLSARAMDTEMKTGVLKALKVKDLPMSRSFYLIRDKRRIVSPLCQAMLDFLQSTREQ